MKMIKRLIKKVKKAYLVYNFKRYIKAGNYSHPSPKYKALNRLNTQKFWKSISEASKRAFERMVANTEMQLFVEPVLGAKASESISFKNPCTLNHEADACRYLYNLDYEKKAINNHMAPSGIDKVFPIKLRLHPDKLKIVDAIKEFSIIDKVNIEGSQQWRKSPNPIKLDNPNLLNSEISVVTPSDFDEGQG